MSLEDRVETLEHELKILKNEIESTLLEIQNQVLVHYYPAFRAEEPAPPKERLPLGGPPAPTAAPIKSMDMEADYVQPKTREVSLSTLKVQSDPMGPLLQAPPMRFKREVVALDDDEDEFADSPLADEPLATGATAETPLTQAALTHLARWVSESVEKIGKARTQEMIESSANAAYGMPAVMDALWQLLEMSAEETSPVHVTTKDLMDVLLKFNRMLDQVAKVSARV